MTYPNRLCVFYGGSMDGVILPITDKAMVFIRPIVSGKPIAKEVYRRVKPRKFQFERIAKPQEIV